MEGECAWVKRGVREWNQHYNTHEARLKQTDLCVKADLYVCWFVFNLTRMKLLQVIKGHLQPLHACLDEVQVELHRESKRHAHSILHWVYTMYIHVYM